MAVKVQVNVVNAFTVNGIGGNPAGVFLNDQKLTETQMQQVAKVVGASESVFASINSKSVPHLRFFTPEIEVPLCGHASIACWSFMKQKGLYGPGRYTQKTQAGAIQIELEDTGKVYIQMPNYKVGAPFDDPQLLSAIGAHPGALNEDLPPRFADDALMICLKTEKQLNQLKPNEELLVNMSAHYSFSVFHVFVLSGPNPSNIFAKVRNFCPILGIPEDPATGTTNGSFLMYLQQLNRLPVRQTYKIEQGVIMKRPSNIYGKLLDGKVWIGGEAVHSKLLEIEL